MRERARAASPVIPVVAAILALAWVNQGPSASTFDKLATDPHPTIALRAWLPCAFLYRRSADEELYYAVAQAIRGLPYDAEVLRHKRGAAGEAFLRAPAADGRWHTPYSEVPFEYPIALLPFVLLPAMVSPSFEVFARVFGALMAALNLGACALAIEADRSMTPRGRAIAWWTATLLFLAQGGLLVQRLDAVVALSLAAALWAATRIRPLRLGAAVGFVAAAKVVPALVAWPIVAGERKLFRSGTMRVRLALGAALGLAVGLLPMAALSPAGTLLFFRYHAARGIHVESTYGVLLSAAWLASGRRSPATLSFGSFNLGGPLADFFAGASAPLVLCAVLAVGYAVLRARAAFDDRRVALAGLLGLTCIWLFSKVFSPQYLTWGIPFAVAANRRPATWALLGSMAIAQLYLRGFYDQVVAMQPLGVTALLLRLAALIGLAAASWPSAAPSSGQPEIRLQGGSRSPSSSV